VLERVSGQLHEACSLSVLDQTDIVYVARAATQRILSIGLFVGSRLPAYCTSMGRVLLAGMPSAELSAYLDRVTLVPRTKHTIVSRTALLAELRRVRNNGYALVDQELELGLRSIAVPVRKPDGTVVAAVNSGVQTSRVDRKVMVRDFLPVIQSAAEEIAFALGHGVR
jgi:IclR family pca regulon transcriptional regulator